MSPYTRRFVHGSLNMRPGTGFIHRSVDRPNIYIAARRIRHGIATHRDLYFLFPQGCSHPRDIPQTVVFTDSRKDAHHACAEFWKLVPDSWRAQYPMTFAECSTINTSIRRWAVMAAFRAGVCRILFATEVAGMGVDFPTVERVIQWRIGPHMTIASLLQRMGRACRQPNSQGVFLLFYTRPYVIPQDPDHPMFLYTADPSGDRQRLERCIRGVADWAQGKKGERPINDPLDVPVVPYAQVDSESDSDVDNIEQTLGHDCSRSADDCTETSFEDFDFPDQDLEPGSSDPGDLAMDTHSDITQSASESDSETDNDDEDSQTIQSASTVSLNSDNESLASRQRASSEEALDADSSRRRKFPAGCRGIVWFINTTGCRRAVLRVLHDDAGYDSWDHIVESDVIVPGTETCCDHHCPTHADELPDTIRQLLAQDEDIEPGGQSSDVEDLELPDTAPIRKVSRLQQQQVRHALRTLREEIHWEISKGDIFFPYTAQTFISDDYINKWSRGCGTINSEADILGRVSSKTHSPQHLTPFLSRILATIQETLARSQPPPARRRGRQRKERAPFIPLHIIPSDADVEDPSTQLLLAENERLRVEHELNEDKLQARRRRQRERMAWNNASRSDRNQRGRSGLRASNIPVNYALAPNSSEPAVSPTFQADITEEPAQLPPPPKEGEEGLPSDIYAERNIPSEVQTRLPKRRRGRPSKKEHEERRQIIKEYWKERGYISNEDQAP
jgi:hypothetical protein